MSSLITKQSKSQESIISRNFSTSIKFTTFWKQMRSCLLILILISKEYPSLGSIWDLNWFKSVKVHCRPIRRRLLRLILRVWIKKRLSWMSFRRQLIWGIKILVSWSIFLILCRLYLLIHSHCLICYIAMESI